MVTALSSSTYERHCENLMSLFRICGCMFTGYSVAKFNQEFNQELQNVFSVDPIITSQAKRDGTTGIVPILWIPHSNECTTCVLRAAKSKGRPKRKARGMGGGRPPKKGT